MNQGGIPSTFPLSTLADPHVKTPFTKDDVCSLHGPGASVLLRPLQKQTRFKRTSGLQRLFRALGGGLERGGKVHGKVKTWAYFLRFLESMGVCDCVYKGTSMHASKLYLDRIFRIILFSSDRGLACSEVINLKWIQEPLLLHRFRRNTCYGRTCELHIWAIKHFAQTPARAWYLQSREESICNRTWKKNWWTMWVENPAKRKRQIERVPCQQQ